MSKRAKALLADAGCVVADFTAEDLARVERHLRLAEAKALEAVARWHIKKCASRERCELVLEARRRAAKLRRP